MRIAFRIWLIALALATYSSAQAVEKEVLFKGEVEHSGYCEMSNKATSFDSKPANLFGYSCAWLMNDKFYFGASTHGSTGPIAGFGSYYYQGGAIVGYYFKPEKLFHVSTQLFTGSAGLASLSPFNYTVLEPSITLNLNLTKFAKLQLGYGYRFIDGTDGLTGLGPKQLNGSTISLGVLINPFDMKYPFKEMWNR